MKLSELTAENIRNTKIHVKNEHESHSQRFMGHFVGHLKEILHLFAVKNRPFSLD